MFGFQVRYTTRINQTVLYTITPSLVTLVDVEHIYLTCCSGQLQHLSNWCDWKGRGTSLIVHFLT